MRRHIPNSQKMKRKTKQRERKRRRQKEPSKSYASRRPRIQPKEKTDIGSSPRGESRKIHRLLLGAFSRISKYLTDMVVGTPLIAHVEVRRVAWKWLVTNEPSGLSLCRPCPVHRRRRCRCRRQACQPAFFWWDGWMDGWMYTYYLDSHVLDGCCAVLCCAGLVPTRILPTRLSEHVAAAPLYM